MSPYDYCVCTKCLAVVRCNELDGFGRCRKCHDPDGDVDWIAGVLNGG